MTTTTTNLGLVLYNDSTDISGSFFQWQISISGSINSSMMKIDNWSGSASGSFTEVSGSISGSFTNVNNSLSSISGSLAEISGSISSYLLRFKKIAEFTGSGSADFNNIPQTYTHLLVMGTVISKISGSSAFGCDFNSDANSANYDSLQWEKHTSTLESLTRYRRGEILLGLAPGYAEGHGTSFFAIIPNYSGSGIFYKTGMGVTSFRGSGVTYKTGTVIPKNQVSYQGGVWKNTNAITRIRFFTLIPGTSSRLEFTEGTKISLYGL